MSKPSVACVEALWGSFIGDALSMPVHWFYNPPDIKRLCGGWIEGYIPPPDRHPTCILTASAVDSTGRSSGSQKSRKPVIGNVILHDKLKYWQAGDRTVHYHRGMAAGDNTLNSLCAVRIMDVLLSEDPNHDIAVRDLRASVFEKYFTFMTNPGTHNDTYAESWHRAIFRDWSDLNSPPTTGADFLHFLENRSRRMLTEPPDAQLASVGALVCAVPWVVHYAGAHEDVATAAAVDFVNLTHPARGLAPFVELFVRGFHAVLNGQPVREIARSALLSDLLGNSRTQLDELLVEVAVCRDPEAQIEAYQDVVARLGMACYIKGALNTMFFIAHQFADDFEAGVLMNANVGGENCHRGAALGALLGAGSVQPAARGMAEGLKSGLHSIVDQWSRVRARME